MIYLTDLYLRYKSSILCISPHILTILTLTLVSLFEYHSWYMIIKSNPSVLVFSPYTHCNMNKLMFARWKLLKVIDVYKIFLAFFVIPYEAPTMNWITFIMPLLFILYIWYLTQYLSYHNEHISKNEYSLVKIQTWSSTLYLIE